MSSSQVAKLLLEINAVTFRFNPPYTYTSGLKSPIYLDNRLIVSYPRVRSAIIDSYIEVIKQNIGLNRIDWISGTATAAIPHAAFIAERLNLPMVYVRSIAKKHGKGEQIEGFLKPGANVLVIEDHVSTGGSSIENALAIRAAGGLVTHCVATTSYETDKSITRFKDANIKLHYLVSGREIINTAYIEGLINMEQKKSIDLWFDNPVGWGKN